MRTKVSRRMAGQVCPQCQQPFQIGDRVVFREAVHVRCNPGAFGAVPAAQTVEQVRLNALVALEDALVTMAAQSKNGVGAQLDKQFEKYQKLKAVALRPGTPGEELTALRFALIEAVKMVF